VFTPTVRTPLAGPEEHPGGGHGAAQVGEESYRVVVGHIERQPGRGLVLICLQLPEDRGFSISRRCEHGYDWRVGIADLCDHAFSSNQTLAGLLGPKPRVQHDT
jgi:hypothetical protein